MIVPKCYFTLTATAEKHEQCEVAGNIAYWTCDECGTIYSDEWCQNTITADDVVINPRSHIYDDGVVTAEPTCTTAGVRTFTCTRDDCDYTRTEPISALGHDVQTIVIDATCEEDGETYVGCTRCGSVFGEKEVIPKLGHNYISEVTKEETCTEDGVITYTCENCGDTYTEVIPAGHDLMPVETPATCTKVGIRQYYCQRCGNYIGETEIIPVLGHIYDDGVVVKEPKCYEKGEMLFTCTREGCGATYTEEIEMTEHSYQSEVSTPATCDSNGERTVFCTNDGCGYSYTEVIPALEHDFDDGTVVREATCTEDGEILYKCTHSGCDFTYSDTIPATGHTYSETSSRPATCLEDGESVYICSSCGNSYTEIKPATGHSFGEWTTTKEPSCEESGVEKRRCGNCGDYEVRTLSPLNHAFDKNYTIDREATCMVNGSKSIHCALCGFRKDITEIPATGHSFTRTVTKEASCTADGELTVACHCGVSYTETIPATGHTFGEWVIVSEPTESTAGSKERVCEACGFKETETIPIIITPETESTITFITNGGTEIEPITAKVGTKVTAPPYPTMSGFDFISWTDEEGNNVPVPSTMPEYDLTLFAKWSVAYYTVKWVVEETETVVSVRYGDNIPAQPTPTKDGCVFKGWTPDVPDKMPDFNLIFTAVFESSVHEHSYKETITKEATCTEDGIRTYICTSCFESYSETIPALGHEPGEVAVENQIDATCKKAGKYDEVIYCTRCGIEISRREKELKKLEHVLAEPKIENYLEATYTSEGRYDEVVYCSVCGDEISRNTIIIEKVAHNHIYEEALTKEPLCDEEGIRTYTCTLCGNSYTESIPALEHTEPDENGNCSRCGSHLIDVVDPNACPQCGQVHEGFFGGITGFFHRLVYRLKNIFK